MKLLDKTKEKHNQLERDNDIYKRDDKENEFKDLKTEKKSKSSKTFHKKKKDDNSLGEGVTSLVVITKIQVLAASYLNGKIVLWDLLQMKIRKTYDNLKSVINTI